MRDLLVIVPSRGRPGRLADMMTACLSLSQTSMDIAVAFDDDDPEREAYELLRERDAPSTNPWYSGPRDTLTGWTNRAALENAGRYRALASLGDDHMPRTKGWDRLLLEAIDGMGGTGIAYGDDLLQRENLPTAPVISSDIVAALGWMALPACRHYKIDNAWKELGTRAGCLAYRPDVVIEHCCPGAGKALFDATYAEGAARDTEDDAPYAAWLADQADADAGTIRGLRRADVR